MHPKKVHFFRTLHQETTIFGSLKFKHFGMTVHCWSVNGYTGTSVCWPCSIKWCLLNVKKILDNTSKNNYILRSIKNIHIHNKYINLIFYEDSSHFPWSFVQIKILPAWRHLTLLTWKWFMTVQSIMHIHMVVNCVIVRT